MRIPARITMVRRSTSDPTKETIRIYSDRCGIQDLRVAPGSFTKDQDVTVEFDKLHYSNPQPATAEEIRRMTVLPEPIDDQDS